MSLSLQIFSTGTTPIYDAGNELLNGEGLWYEEGYPTGYLSGGINIPRDPFKWWEVKGTLRVVVRDGQKIVYEGVIPNLQDRFTPSSMGKTINFTGFFGWSLLGRTIHKRWADSRVDAQTWELDISNPDDEPDRISSIDRRNRLRFLPKAEAWGNGDYVAVTYALKGLDDIARVYYKCNLQEGGQSWEISLWRSPDGSAWTQMDTNGTSGDVYNTGTTTIITASTGAFPGTPTEIDVEPNGTITHLQFRYYARANQTPTSDGAYFASITELMVYSEDEGATGINLDSVAADLIAEFTDVFNSDTSYLDASDNVRQVEPFITQGDRPANLADVLYDIADFGDSNDLRYAVGLKDSESAATPNGLPVLFTSDWPLLTDYDYFINLDNPQIVSNVTITEDFDSVQNYLTVTYRDEKGWQQIITPTDQATLTDSTSVTAYGQRDATISLGNSTAANALEYGVRYLAQWKDPRKIVNGTIKVLGSLAGKGGQEIPFSQVRAGQRLKIDGYDTYVISRTRVDYDARVVSLTLGGPEDLLFNDSVFDTVWNDAVPGVDEGGGSGGSGPDLAERLGMTWLKKSNNPRWKRIKSKVQNYMKDKGVNAKRAARKLGYGHLMRF